MSRSPLAELERDLTTSRILASFDARRIAELARASHRSVFQRGDHLWRAGTSGRRHTIIVAGLVKLVKPTPAGDAIIGIFGPRESIGDIAILGGRPYPANAIAASDSVEIVQIDAAALGAMVQATPALGKALNDALIDHMHALHFKIGMMSAGTVPRRLATLFLHLAERFGAKKPDGSIEVRVALSRAELAALVGATVETTIRAMSRWQKDGLVRTLPDGFVIRSAETLATVVIEG